MQRSYAPFANDEYGSPLRPPRRRVDARLLRALDLLDEAELSVTQAARRVDLSESRLTHLMTETLGAPPRTWRTWLRLQRAIRERLLGGATLTQAAHRAGFADSAHLTRTCKQLTGVRPGQMLPSNVRLSLLDGGAGRARQRP